jgi:CRP-like cAMP-binding protein
LGKVYHDREVIVHQGEAGDGLFVIQEGQLEILSEAMGGRRGSGSPAKAS